MASRSERRAGAADSSSSTDITCASADGAGASAGDTATGADGSVDTVLSLGAVRFALRRLRGRCDSLGCLGFFFVIVEGQFTRKLRHITPLPLKVNRSVTAPAIASSGST